MVASTRHAGSMAPIHAPESRDSAANVTPQTSAWAVATTTELFNTVARSVSTLTIVPRHSLTAITARTASASNRRRYVARSAPDPDSVRATTNAHNVSATSARSQHPVARCASRRDSVSRTVLPVTRAWELFARPLCHVAELVVVTTGAAAVALCVADMRSVTPVTITRHFWPLLLRRNYGLLSSADRLSAKRSSASSRFDLATSSREPYQFPALGSGALH